MINSKALRNMEAIPYMTQMMPSVQEPVRFKLNWPRPWVGFLYLSFLEPNDILSFLDPNDITTCTQLIHWHYGEYHIIIV